MTEGSETIITMTHKLRLSGYRNLASVLFFCICVVITTLLFLGTGYISEFTSRSADKIQPASDIELERYVEDVFRRQNQTSSAAVVFLIDNDSFDGKTLEKIGRAEDKLVEACGPLNEYAISKMQQMFKMEQSQPQLALKARILRTVKSCDQAARTLGKLLESTGETSTLRHNAI